MIFSYNSLKTVKQEACSISKRIIWEKCHASMHIAKLIDLRMGSESDKHDPIIQVGMRN